MREFKLGTITDEKLAKSICYAMDLGNGLSWELVTKGGKTILNVYADMDAANVKLLEALFS